MSTFVPCCLPSIEISVPHTRSSIIIMLMNVLLNYCWKLLPQCLQPSPKSFWKATLINVLCNERTRKRFRNNLIQPPLLKMRTRNPRAHTCSLHSCFWQKIKTQAEAVYQPHVGRHPCRVWAPPDFSTSGKLGAGSRCSQLALFSHRPKRYMASPERASREGTWEAQKRRSPCPFSCLSLPLAAQKDWISACHIKDSHAPRARSGTAQGNAPEVLQSPPPAPLSHQEVSLFPPHLRTAHPHSQKNGAPQW